MVDYRDRLLEAMEAVEMTAAELAAAMGVSYQAVKKLLDGKSKSFTAANNELASEALGVTSKWLASGVGSKKRLVATEDAARLAADESPATYAGGVAQFMSLKDQTVGHLRPTAWGAIMSIKSKEDLAPLFSTVMPDDSMAPRARAGAVLMFNRDAEPRPGDGVLVKDQQGDVYFRVFKQRRAGAWEAHAFHEDYQALDSERDGLVVLGVLIALESRWG